MPASKYAWDGVEVPSSFPHPPLRVRVTGLMACFTRPEHKSERVSYPLITPTAAAGVLESVFWKPEFRYLLTRIDVLARPTWATVRTNETSEVISVRSPVPIDTAATRQQRTSLLLRDVAYRLHAQILVHPDARTATVAKFRDQLRRRVERGQAFRAPYLGMREMVADISVDDPTERPTAWSEEVGPMLHSIARDSAGRESYGWFDARVVRGVMAVPAAPAVWTGAGHAVA